MPVTLTSTGDVLCIATFFERGFPTTRKKNCDENPQLLAMPSFRTHRKLLIEYRKNLIASDTLAEDVRQSNKLYYLMLNYQQGDFVPPKHPSTLRKKPAVCPVTTFHKTTGFAMTSTSHRDCTLWTTREFESPCGEDECHIAMRMNVSSAISYECLHGWFIFEYVFVNTEVSWNYLQKRDCSNCLELWAN